MKRYLWLLILSAALTKSFSQAKELDSLRQVIKSQVQDTIRLSAMHEMLWYLSQDKCLELNEQIINYAKAKAGSSDSGSVLWKAYLFFVVDGYYNKAIFLSNKSLPDSALPFYEKSIEMSSLIGSLTHIAYCESSMGLIYVNKGNLAKGAQLLYKALQSLETLKDYEGMGEAYNTLGSLHYKQRHYPKAVEDFEKAYHYFERSGTKSGMADALYKLAIVYTDMGKYEESVSSVRKSIDLLNGLGEKEQTLQQQMLNSAMGQLHYRKNEMKEALACFEKNIAMAKTSQRYYGLGFGYLHAGLCHYHLKNYSRAIDYGTQALEISRREKDIDFESKTAGLLYLAYKATHNYTQAFDMNDLNIRLKDSLQSREIKEKVLEQQFIYEFDKKELQSKALQEKKISDLRLEAEQKNTRKNIWIIALISLFMLLSAGSYFIYSNFKQKNTIHAQKNNLLKQKLLLSQMNPHFIFNSLNAIQNFIMKQDSLQAGVYLAQFSEMIRMILDFSRKDYVTLEAELHFLKLYMNLQQLRSEHTFDYSFVIDESIETDRVLVPPMLAQPFIENAIVHGGFHHQKGSIAVSVSQHQDALIYSIEDNGMGIQASMALKNKQNGKHESLATKITLERLETLYFIDRKNYKIDIEDKHVLDPGQTGVKVTFAIPFKEA
jgi:tetratricopeptide (TPR) repeat protein